MRFSITIYTFNHMHILFFFSLSHTHTHTVWGLTAIRSSVPFTDAHLSCRRSMTRMKPTPVELRLKIRETPSPWQQVHTHTKIINIEILKMSHTLKSSLNSSLLTNRHQTDKVTSTRCIANHYFTHTYTSAFAPWQTRWTHNVSKCKLKPIDVRWNALDQNAIVVT